MKGYRFEHFVEQELIRNGIPAKRRGQANQEDIHIDGLGNLECKCWAKGLKTIYNLKGDNKFLAIKWQSKEAKGKKPLVCMELDVFIELLKRGGYNVCTD